MSRTEGGKGARVEGCGGNIGEKEGRRKKQCKKRGRRQEVDSSRVQNTAVNSGRRRTPEDKAEEISEGLKRGGDKDMNNAIQWELTYSKER